jgi:hypothetical protein
MSKKVSKHFFFEKKKQKTFWPLRAALGRSPSQIPVMPAHAGIHDFSPPTP